MTTLPKINLVMESHFGKSWVDLETETLSLELGLIFDELTHQKVSLLKVLIKDSRSFETKDLEFHEGARGLMGVDEARIGTDPVFAIHACDLINDIEIEPATIAMPTLLELAYALKTLSELPINFNPAHYELWHMLCENILKEEGVDRPLGPFTFLSESKFPERVRTESELNAINVAIKTYISMMDAGEGKANVSI